MGSNNTRLKIKLSHLKIDRTNLEIEAKGLCHSITEILVPELTDIEEMDVAKASTLMDELMVKQGELLGLQRKTYELEKALG